jgi:hypothetical protein
MEPTRRTRSLAGKSAKICAGRTGTDLRCFEHRRTSRSPGERHPYVQRHVQAAQLAALGQRKSRHARAPGRLYGSHGSARTRPAGEDGPRVELLGGLAWPRVRPSGGRRNRFRGLTKPAFNTRRRLRLHRRPREEARLTMKAYTRTVRAVRMPDLTHAAFERFKPVATTVPAACRQRPSSAVTREGSRSGREPVTARASAKAYPDWRRRRVDGEKDRASCLQTPPGSAGSRECRAQLQATGTARPWPSIAAIGWVELLARRLRWRSSASPTIRHSSDIRC